MLKLPHDCRASELAVSPKNWNTKGASTCVDWYINYRFYEPGRAKPKQVVLKGMNRTSDLSERRGIVKGLIKEETEMLLAGYNPRLKKTVLVVSDEPVDYEIPPTTPFASACLKAVKLMKADAHTIRDANNYMKHIVAAATRINLHDRSISDISRRHIRMILDAVGNLKQKAGGSWTPNMYNTYRANLGMVFKVLVELEAVDGNPVKEVAKQATLKKVKQVLSLKERIQVNEHLKQHRYTFWRYMQIFFHSGSRTKELFRLKGADVKLADQRFKLVVKKGKKFEEQWRPIKNIALAYWEEVMVECRPEQYVFSRGLVPGDKPINAIQISRRWRKHVKAAVVDLDPEKGKKQKKGGLGIEIDFYSLKHLNLDQTAVALDIEQASKMAGHASTVITMNYAVGEKERQMERLKKVENPFT